MKKRNKSTIFIVDDEVVITIGLEEMLTAMGYEVIDIAHSGDEALEKARNHQPNLMLLDIKIPGTLDGIQLAEIVKTELDIPVIFLTAYSEDKTIERAKKVEPYGYVVKPFQERELKAAIEVALYKKDMERRLRESKLKLKKAHDELEKRVEERTKELNTKTKSLEELNTAMKVLLEKRVEDKRKLEDNVLLNVKELLVPLIDSMKKTELDTHQKMILNILESNISEITANFARKLSLEHFNLTPTELKIANYIKHGTTTKEISRLMKSSPRTIETHRKNIRKKVGLHQKRGNLRSYLLSLH